MLFITKDLVNECNFKDKFQLFHTKAETLAYLSAYKELNIPPLLFFTVGEWQNSRDLIYKSLNQTFKTWKTSTIVVRSSSSNEDRENSSGAGAFTSVLNVTQNDFAEAIEKVIASYGSTNENEQILVQPMLQDIVLSGVVMTRVLTDGAPYYVINYDDSGKTDIVTSGVGISKTVFVFRSANPADFDSPRVKRIVELARQCERICQNDALDLEFCLSSDGNLYLLQVRPICTQDGWIPQADLKVRTNINFITSFLETRMTRRPELFGDTTILGVMTDWNPAEMLGLTPRRLASSLYRELITRRVWSQAREIMGYRKLPPLELMLLIAGRPYIDIRLSCNSFLPEGLDPVSGEALIAAWLDRLDRNPALHDKLEFEVAQTCQNFSFDSNFDNRYPEVLSKARREVYKDLLTALTRECLNLKANGSMIKALDAISELRARQVAFPKPNSCKSALILPIIAKLMEECKTFGTLPFSILARHAFIAESLLRSAVDRGVLTLERLAKFKASLHTIASKLAADFDATAQGRRSKESFLAKYGHLRPSTYDILSLSYAERQDLFTTNSSLPIAPPLKNHFTFTKEESHGLARLLAEAKLPEDVNQFETYLRKAIPGREMAKFVFTRHVSAILDLIKDWGESIGLNRDNLSFLDIREILEWDNQALLRSPQSYFSDLVLEGRKLFDLSRSLKLGYLIRSPRDVKVVAQHRSAPNFVGNQRVEAPVCRLGAESSGLENLDGHIICIENADPGFDWIFTRNIAGLITMFGGTNSHMAIRCAEYGLSAAIGVGEVLFEQVIRAKRCLLQPDGGILQPLTEI